MERDTVTLAFFKAFDKDNYESSIKSKCIAWYTRGPYSHVAILMKDAVMCDLAPLIEYASDPEIGSVIKKDHLYDERVWDYVTIPVNDVSNLEVYLNSLVGAKYDYLGILGFILPTKDRSDRWFCSEYISNGLKIDGKEYMWYIEPSSISPNKLYSLVKKEEITNG